MNTCSRRRPFENEPVKRLVDICVVACVAHTTAIYVAMLLDPHISTLTSLATATQQKARKFIRQRAPHRQTH